MIFRPFKASDIPEIAALYQANGAKDGRTLDNLPDLSDPTRVFAYVVEDDGKVRAAFIFRSIVEAITVADGSESWKFAMAHQQDLRDKFKLSRIRRIVTWTPRKSVGRVLKKFGWWKVPSDTEAWETEV